ncbi:MAG TPA: ribosome small subunit-dependent GTPase A [Thermoanaerobaculia bacterium]|nr:ribosome small subunit-dependent GTPase A [Thermoanaerobaculia bacterium]
MILDDYGWRPELAASFTAIARPGWIPGRVCAESHEIYRLATEQGDLVADLAGGLRYRAASKAELPTVGDWVAVQPVEPPGRSIVQAVLPRSTQLVRRAAGEKEEAQVLAANVDTVWILTSVNRDWNPRRLERYLTMARSGGVLPVLVLSKADLAQDASELVAAARALAGGGPVHLVSTKAGRGLEDLGHYLRQGETIALLGSSGVGKSTLVNFLLGEERQKVLEIREDDGRGRHSTTRRELFPLPRGGILVDTPGLRELALLSDLAEAEQVFDDVESLAANCRFRDCGHRGEPGCAVGAAVAEGRMEPERLAAYHKLLAEEKARQERELYGSGGADRRRWKAIHKALRK